MISRLHALRARIFIAIAAILALVASAVMIYSLVAVREAVIEAEERSVQNVLGMADMAIRNEYRTLLSGKVNLVQERKRQFREFDRTVIETLHWIDSLRARGLMDEPLAQDMARQWLSSIRPTGGEYLMAFDRDGRVFVHPDASLIGTQPVRYTDFKGRNVMEAAWQEIDRYGEAFLLYEWKALGSGEIVPRYGHFVGFIPWDWVIVSVGDMEDVQREADARLERFRRELDRSLSQVRVVGDGFVFVFDGQGQSVVQPASSLPLDAATLASLRTAADGGVAVDFTTSDGRDLRAWVKYIRPLDWYVSVVASPAQIAAPAHSLVSRQALVFGGGLALGLLLAWVVASGIAGPLTRLGKHARALSGVDFTQPEKSIAVGLPTERRDEVGELARAFEFMETELHRNVRSLMEATGERERMEGELGVARDIQLGLLPKLFPAFPDRPDIDVFATLVSAREVGGDLYDFHLVDDELYFTIGDVAGKGVPAALFMAITKTLIKVASDDHKGPGETLRHVNESLAHDNPNAMFVTAINGRLDCRSGRIRYANGGHNPPVIVRRDGRLEMLRKISGPALGAMDGMDFDTFETRLEPGDLLLLYSDGVTEAMDVKHALYGEQRLLALLETCAGKPSADFIVEAIMRSVREHASGAEQSDDITLLALLYRGPDSRHDSARSTDDQ